VYDPPQGLVVQGGIDTGNGTRRLFRGRKGWGKFGKNREDSGGVGKEETKVHCCRKEREQSDR